MEQPTFRNFCGASLRSFFTTKITPLRLPTDTGAMQWIELREKILILILFLAVPQYASTNQGVNMEADALLNVVFECRDAKELQRLGYFSKEFLVSRLWSIIRFQDKEHTQLYADISKDIINICSSVNHVYGTEVWEVTGRTNLRIKYSADNIGEVLEVVFGFIQENGEWVISFVSGPRQLNT